VNLQPSGLTRLRPVFTRARLAVVTGVLLCWLGGVPAAASALPYVISVTTAEDRGLADNSNYCSGEGAGGEECPLRAALETANQITGFNGEGIVVSVPEGHYLLSKARGPLPLGDAHAKSCIVEAAKQPCPVTLQGAGAARTIIDGQNNVEILKATEEAGPVTVAGVTLTHGYAERGGAIYSFLAALTVRESVFTENSAAEGGGAIEADYSPSLVVEHSSIVANRADFGGGILAHVSPVNVLDTTISGNRALTASGGGITLEQNAGTETFLTDSTIAGNAAATSGGGISAVGSASVALRYSTLTANTAVSGGAVSGATPLTIEGSILAGDSPDECESPATDAAIGANIVFGPSSCLFSGPTPLAVDPRLGSPSANGGLGATAPLLRGSPAVDAGGASCPFTEAGSGQVDERGIRRPQGAGCDLGAFESAADAAVTLTASPNPVTVGSSLVLTATASNAGLDSLTGVSLTIPVPAGASFLSAPSGCVAAFAATTTVTCQIGSLSPGQAKPVSIAIRPERPETLLDTASALADQADYNAANNSATTESLVTAPVTQGPPTGTPATTTTAATSALVGRVLAVDSHGNVTIRVSCTGSPGTRCQDALALYSSHGVLPPGAARHKHPRATLLARGRVTLQAGRTATVRLHLDAAGLKLIRAHHAPAARLLLNLNGSTAAHSYTVKLAAHRR
jgi:hypothetical protein